MWEVVTVGGTPYKGFDLNDLHTHLMSGIRLKRPEHCTQPLYDVMLSCWENIPQHRPLFSEIIEQLNNLNHLKMVCSYCRVSAVCMYVCLCMPACVCV